MERYLTHLSLSSPLPNASLVPRTQGSVDVFRAGVSPGSTAERAEVWRVSAGAIRACLLGAASVVQTTARRTAHLTRGSWQVLRSHRVGTSL